MNKTNSCESNKIDYINSIANKPIVLSKAKKTNNELRGEMIQ